MTPFEDDDIFCDAGSTSKGLIATSYPCSQDIQKAEKKKIMKVVQKILSNIKCKEKREKAREVLTRIVDESKVPSLLMHF